MPEIGIEFECEREEAELRQNLAGHGEVTEDGNYYREEEVPVVTYQKIRNLAEKDEDASIRMVSM
jgi:hypothetical protein